MQRDVANDAIALVEDRQHRDPLRHRRDPGLACGRRGLSRGHLVLFGAAIAGGERERGEQRDDGFVHAYSGIHGS
jgi:hypothetical protein